MTQLIVIALYILPTLSAHPYLVLVNESAIASPHQFPWLVSIQVPALGEWHHRCGGSLIALRGGQTESDIVVSGAHCFGECFSYCAETGTTQEDRHYCKAATERQGESIGRHRIIAGDHALEDYDSEERNLSLASLKCHKLMDGERMINDVALVKLSSPVKFTQKIQPILLPEQDASTAQYSGCQVAGWGFTGYVQTTNELRYANITIFDEAMCSKFLEQRVYDSDLTLCAGKVRKDIHQVGCRGDSGGPLVCADENGASTFAGVLSHGTDQLCLEPGEPDVYTNVAAYVEWIAEKAEEMTSVQSK